MPPVALQVHACGAMVFVDACVMAPKTFAHGWATLAAMDRPRDHSGIVLERPDDRMLGEELEWLLPVGFVRDQLPERAEPKSVHAAVLPRLSLCWS